MNNNNSTYKRLGDYIREVDVRNTDLNVNKLVGLTIAKAFIPSVANTIGTDLSKYKVIKENQFACSLMQVSRDGKMPIAIFKGEDAIMSPAYPVFEICNEELLPDYLNMWFMRPEFDREAVFYAVGGVRGSLDWNDFMDMKLPIPSLEEQQRIVNRYQAIENRIANNKQTITKLEEAAQALYRKMFVDDIDVENLPEGWRMGTLGEVAEIKGGKRLPQGSSLVKDKNKHPYIKIADMKGGRYITLDNTFEYVSDEIVYKQISRYIVNTGDVLLSIVGTIGIVSIVDESLNGANQTENCVKITKLKEVPINYVYQYLISSNGQQNIDQATVGAVQKKLPLYNIQSLPMLIPNNDVLKEFDGLLKSVATYVKTLTAEQNNLTEMLSLLMVGIGR